MKPQAERLLNAIYSLSPENPEVRYYDLVNDEIVHIIVRLKIKIKVLAQEKPTT